jgi:hypothetical protein
MSQSARPKFQTEALIAKARRLPTRGQVYVEEGDTVETETIVANGTVRNPDVHEINIASKLGTDPELMKRYMLKKEGDEVKKDEAFAIRRSFFRRMTKICRSPIDGTIELVSTTSGRALIRGLPIPVETRAHIPGKVVKLIPGEGAVIETMGTIVNGLFGVGGEVRGEIVVAVESPQQALTTDEVKEGHDGKILVGGSFVTLEALRKAAELGVRGIIAGGVDQKDLTEFLGYEIGVGITGEEETGLTLIITDGFGISPMDKEVFELLGSLEGKQASIDGSTQIRYMALRPEIIVPL